MSLMLGLVLMAAQNTTAEKQVTFVGPGKLTLFGSLMMPTKKVESGSVPAVLLLPGSGPTNRDGNSPPTVITDILKQIAVALADQGVASLRFDKRATRAYQPSWPKDLNQIAEFFKWENFVGDASAAYLFLRTQPGIDPKRVGIIGHSEGSELALQIGSDMAKDPSRPALIITLAGAGRPMGPILVEQISRALDKQKAPAPVKKQYLDGLDRAMTQVVKDGTYPTDLPGGLGSLFNYSTTKIMQSYLTIDPSKLAANYPGPVLVLNGSHDTQVSPERDAPKLKDALKARPVGTVEMLIVPDMSHNFKSTASGNDDAFAGPIVPLALEKIKQFIVKEFHP